MAKGISKKESLKEALNSHSQFIVDRNKKIDLMFKKLETDPAMRKAFHADPATTAGKFGVILNDEEIFAGKVLKDIALVSLRERLKGNPVAIFDNNCGCPGPGPSSW